VSEGDKNEGEGNMIECRNEEDDKSEESIRNRKEEGE
jgi:hypothetical protein